MEAIDEAIDIAQSNGDYDTIVIGDDFNFPNLVWEENLPSMNLNLSNQEDLFVYFIYKHTLLPLSDMSRL